MKKLFLRSCSLIYLLAVSACQSLPANDRLIRPDKLLVPALPAWIRESQSQQISTAEWQAILNGQGKPETAPSKPLPPASSSTTP